MKRLLLPRLKKRKIGASILFLGACYLIWLLKLQKLEKCHHSLFLELVPSDVKFDRYLVKTQDGFTLQVFRLRKLELVNYDRKPIFLQHGMGSSANQFLTNDRHLSNALILVDKGFDVWLGNSRGSYFSRDHDKWDMSLHEEFWDFSFQHMSWDLIPELQLVTEKTEHDRVDFIGHSMGATMMLAGLSDPDPTVRLPLSKLVRDFYAMTPVVYLVSQIF